MKFSIPGLKVSQLPVKWSKNKLMADSLFLLETAGDSLMMVFTPLSQTTTVRGTAVEIVLVGVSYKPTKFSFRPNLQNKEECSRAKDLEKSFIQAE